MQPRQEGDRDTQEGRTPRIGAGSGSQLPPHVLPLELTVIARHAREMPGPNLSATSAYRQAMFMRTGMMSEIPWVTSPTRSRRSSLRRAGSVDLDKDSPSMGAQTPPRYVSVPLRTPSPLVPDAGEESDFTDGGSEKRGSSRRRRSKQFGGPLTTLPIISYEKRKKGKGKSKLHDSDKEEWEYSTGDEGGSERQSQSSSTLVHRRSEDPFVTPPPGSSSKFRDLQQHAESMSDVDELDVVDRSPPPVPPPASAPQSEQEHHHENEHEHDTPPLPPSQKFDPRHRLGLAAASLIATVNSYLPAPAQTQRFTNSSSHIFDATSSFVKRVHDNVNTAWSRSQQRRRLRSSFMSILVVCLLLYAVFYEVNRHYANSDLSTYLSKALNVIPMSNVHGLQERLSMMEREISIVRSELSSVRQTVSSMHASKHNDMSAHAELQSRQHAILERVILVESRIEKEMTQLQLHNSSHHASLSNEAQTLLTLKDSIAELINDVLEQRGHFDVPRVDYALESNGASVIKYLTHPLDSLKPSLFAQLKAGALVNTRGPVTALNHELQPGHCWPFKGTRGQLGVRMVMPVYVDAVTIDHVRRELAISVANTPRWMEVWGLVEGKENLERFREVRRRMEASASATEGEIVQTQIVSASHQPTKEGHAVRHPILPNGDTYVRIAAFEYDINASRNIQTFPVLQDVHDLGIPFQTVVLHMDGNWGNEQYTCLYRFRVHGSVEDQGAHI